MQQEPFVSDASPFDPAEFVENPEPRCPCVLLVDTSGSMQGQPIAQLNDGLRVFRDELLGDSLAAKRVEIAVVGFGPARILSEFSTPNLFDPPALVASGDTPMGAAIDIAIDMLEQRKTSYRSAGVAYFRPWIFLLTDGAPTDAWSNAAARVRDGEEKKQFSFFAVGVDGANMNVLSQIAVRQPLGLKGLEFRSMFAWLSQSLQNVSRSQVGDEVALSAPQGWATVG